MALTHGPENVRPQVKQTDDNGNFCFEVCWFMYDLLLLLNACLSLCCIVYPYNIPVKVLTVHESMPCGVQVIDFY